jgi:hypothetical protein
MKFYTTLLLYISITLSITSALKDQQVPIDKEDEERHATVLRKGSRSARTHGEIVRLGDKNRLKREDLWGMSNLKNGRWCVQSSKCKSKCCHNGKCKSTCPPTLPHNGARCWLDSDCVSERCNVDWYCQNKAKLGEFCQFGLDDECEDGFSCSTRNKCFHVPRRSGEPCRWSKQCGDGLYCDFTCWLRNP